jgi:hypothetical protein
MPVRYLLAATLTSLALFLGQAAAEEVDVELILAVDVSSSMDAEELDIQRRGYLEAMRHPDVLSAIESGYLGRIAVTYLEWSGPASQRVIVPWTLIDGAQAADGFANALDQGLELNRDTTSISRALEFAAELFEDNGFTAMRQVIDLSGDQPNNSGPSVLEAREAALARGITINGLPIMVRFGYDILDQYFQECVVGGPGSFIIRVENFQTLAQAIRHKLVLEIAGLQPEPEADTGIVPVQFGIPDRTIDCRRASGWRWTHPR